jgi:hypothetical protein
MPDSATCLYVGFDEAGYGPNLGPLVMTAVAFEGSSDRPPNLWLDLRNTIDRAGGNPQRLWVDDSKRVLAGSHGHARLESTVLALLCALDSDRRCPETLREIFDTLSVGGIHEPELARWLERQLPELPRYGALEDLPPGRTPMPFACENWRVCAVRTAVLGPQKFNILLNEYKNKSLVHFSLFARLFDGFWNGLACSEARVVCDKHGGRHYYLQPLRNAWPDLWIEPTEEGPELSRYILRAKGKRLDLRFQPRAEQADGLVALASMVSKYVRESWMDVFNDFWKKRVTGLKPTAGYPNDAARFRREIEPHAQALGLVEHEWWRTR